MNGFRRQIKKLTYLYRLYITFTSKLGFILPECPISFHGQRLSVRILTIQVFLHIYISVRLSEVMKNGHWLRFISLGLSLCLVLDQCHFPAELWEKKASERQKAPH